MPQRKDNGVSTAVVHFNSSSQQRFHIRTISKGHAYRWSFMHVPTPHGYAEQDLEHTVGIIESNDCYRYLSRKSSMRRCFVWTVPLLRSTEGRLKSSLAQVAASIKADLLVRVRSIATTCVVAHWPVHLTPGL